MDISRRNALIGSAAVLSPAVLASCSGPSIDVIGTVAQFIQKVQQGVSDAIKAACGTAVAYIPTVDTVLAIAAQLLRGTVVAANLAEAVAQIKGIIDTIVAAGCPTPGPAPAPPATLGWPQPAPSPTASFNGVPIRFY